MLPSFSKLTPKNMKIASAIIVTLLATVAPSAGRPQPKDILTFQSVPDGAMAEFHRSEKERADNALLSQRSGFGQTDPPTFSDLLGQIYEGAAKRSEHGTGHSSGESSVHQNSAAAFGKVHSIRQSPVAVEIF